MKVTVTRHDVFNMARTLQGIRQSLDAAGVLKVKTIYQIEKALSTLSKEVELYQGSARQVPEMMEYDNKRMELIRSLAKKDDKGEVVVDEESREAQFTKANREKFDKKMTELAEEYKGAFEEQDKAMAEFQEFLNEEVELDIHAINVNLLPDDNREIINALQFIMPILEEY